MSHDTINTSLFCQNHKLWLRSIHKVVVGANDQYKFLLMSTPQNLITRKFRIFRRLWKHWNFFGNINMFLTYPQNIPMLCQIIAPQNSCLPNKTIHYSVISAAVTCTATPPHLNCPSVTGHRQSMLQNRNLGHITKDNIMSTDTIIKERVVLRQNLRYVDVYLLGRWYLFNRF